MPKRSRSVSPTYTGSTTEGSPPRGRSASPYSKYSRTTSLEPESRSMFCALPPHGPLQLNLDDFERHYAQEHTNRCVACSANLPSAWMLELHIRELHDPLVAAERDKGEKTYKCFVETCERVCSTPPKRRLHLIDKHGYPRDYDFAVVEGGIKPGSTSLLRRGRAKSNDVRLEASKRGGLGKMTGRHARRRSSVVAPSDVETVNASGSTTQTSMDTTVVEEPVENELTALSSKMGSMKLDMTPRSILLKKNQRS